ncbi:MAG TPA: hypothetical protein VGG39_11715 [Polyangiaceae bacterium]|jgi:hypothetical protein
MATERIRARVWVAGILPVVVGIGVVVFLVAGDRRSARPHGDAPSATGEDTARVQLPATTPTVAPSLAPRPPVPSPPPAIATHATPPSPGPSAQAEDIPELAEFVPPPGSNAWSMSDKKAYMRKAFSDLRAREQALEKEQATAHAMGDADTERRKEATIALLRERRTYYERLMASPDALQGRNTGSAPAGSAESAEDAGP